MKSLKITDVIQPQSTVQMTTQIFGVRNDTWQPPSLWNSMQATGCERLAEKKSTFPSRDKCWNSSECFTVVHKWFTITSDLLTGLSHQHCGGQPLVGQSSDKNIKAQFISCFFLKNMPHGFCVLACKIITTFLIKDVVSKKYWFQLRCGVGKIFFTALCQRVNKKANTAPQMVHLQYTVVKHPFTPATVQTTTLLFT